MYKVGGWEKMLERKDGRKGYKKDNEIKLIDLVGSFNSYIFRFFFS